MLLDKYKRLYALTFVIAFDLFFVGCGGALRSATKTVEFRSDLVMKVAVDPNANQNTALAVDVVNVANKKMMDTLLAMSAADWFQKRVDLERSYPKDLNVNSWEWVPGQFVGSVRVRNSKAAKAVILFASYATPGEHRAVLPGHGTVSVNLLEKDFLLSTAN